MKTGRELVNGAKMLPQGFKLDEKYTLFEDAAKRVKKLNKKAEKQGLGYTYNVSGVSGNYCVLAYTGNLITDRRYSHS